jgi:hypothetical protein
MNFGTLVDGPGCFPLAHEAYPSRTDSGNVRISIRSLVNFGSWVTTPTLSSALPLILKLPG